MKGLHVLHYVVSPSYDISGTRLFAILVAQAARAFSKPISFGWGIREPHAISRWGMG
jgi:hypothetical protein